ncbi:choice-of-anchor M domain-containing protein [Microbacterium sp. HD4P20]|uniref:choice-of-anchor M domain-containing protein n=1 Tax=Microbacterium sp. HD4P20 TaxID=2864874 RepID=UPI0020A3E739|nr:choice-of-anchor M domain-containing protein [Microbacterium sp. HD4P20]MCP2636510.1 choice-of-anchor M domain-containing protein [Microbacterium sp. HD4P20]
MNARFLSRLRSPLARAAAAIALAAAIIAPAGATDDEGLDQTLDADMAVVEGERVLDAGHVDMGPKFVDGRWTFLIHDDVAKADANAASVWRFPDQTVFHVLDAGQLTVPDDPAYEFVGAAPGETVWVVPQTQHPEVVWLGWNTQDPEVMQAIDRGVTLSLTGVQGPGIATTYLQSGSFGEPQVLFDSRVPDAQEAWVDVNTHTHANWVFTEPGVYLMRFQAEADLIDGTTVSDSQVLRFAVGSATDPAEALAAQWQGDEDTGGAADPSPGAPESDDAAVAQGAVEVEDPLVPILLGAIGVVTAGLIAAVVVVVVRGRRARRQALASASATGARGERTQS